MNESQIILFVITSLIVILIPGQDLVLVLSRGVTRGARAGLVTAAGVSVGLLGHTLMATAGLGALLLASDFLFLALKYIGAAYLAYLGIRLLVGRAARLDIVSNNAATLRRQFVEGALSNLSNPKITIFYFAYLPQFIAADAAQPALLLFLLGASFALLTFLIKAPIGIFAGIASAWIRSRQALLVLINRISGTVLIALGLRLALESQQE